MTTESTFEHTDPVEQRDLPSPREAIEADPTKGPKPLTIEQYKARTAAREQPPKKKRSGCRIKLLSARRLNIELLKTATNDSDTKSALQLSKVNFVVRSKAA
ncbi:hypothetical protein KR200_003631, partial [Drosophila serrata]